MGIIPEILIFWFSISGALCHTDATHVNILRCDRLLPSAVSLSLTPCSYPCAVRSPGALYEIVLQAEPDGTPCRYLGHCRGGTCLNTHNSPAPFKWSQGFQTPADADGNDAVRNDYEKNIAATSSGAYSEAYVHQEPSSIRRPNVDESSLAEEDETAPPFGKHGSSNAIKRFLRVKRSPRRNNRRYGNRQNAQHGHYSYNDRYAHRAHNPTIVIIEQGKRRKGLKTAGLFAAGAAAGAATGVGAAALLSHGKEKGKHGRSSSSEEVDKEPKRHGSVKESSEKSETPSPTSMKESATSSGTEGEVSTTNLGDTGVKEKGEGPGVKEDVKQPTAKESKESGDTEKKHSTSTEADEKANSKESSAMQATEGALAGGKANANVTETSNTEKGVTTVSNESTGTTTIKPTISTTNKTENATSTVNNNGDATILPSSVVTSTQTGSTGNRGTEKTEHGNTSVGNGNADSTKPDATIPSARTLLKKVLAGIADSL